MREAKSTIPAAPTSARAGDPVAANLRVVDSSTGETIEKVIEADAVAGTVRRFAVEGGNLVREGNALKVIEEEREIRIEWIDPPAAEGDQPADDVTSGESDA